MAIERFYKRISPVNFTADGQANGIVTIDDTFCFKVKMKVVLEADGKDPLRLEVKRVLSKTQMILGPIDQPIHTRKDISEYVLGINPTVEAPEQERPKIPPSDYERATYEEEPTVAKRVIPVNKYGEPNSPENPLYAQLSDGSIEIGTVNAELEVQLSHKDNDPDAGDIHDSVRIGDGEETASISEGALDVNFVLTSDNVIKSTYSEILNVANSVNQVLVTYTVPVSKTARLQISSFSGQNIAEYTITLNGTPIDKKRTYFGGSLNGCFDFRNFPGGGLSLLSEDEIVVEVTHNRPMTGNFNGRIQVLEIG